MTKKRLIGNYEILGKIERNWPHFTICAAMQVGLDRRVELRVFQEPLEKHSPLMARFQREYQTLAQLDHPRIMKILDMGFGSGRAFYVTDLRPARSLGDALKLRKAPFSPRRILALAGDMAEALVYLHGRQILHRNLGLETIFHEEENDYYYINEFSLGRDLSKKSLTERGVPQLAPMTFTPECLQEQGTDERTDLYLLGMVCHALATGKAPRPRLERGRLGQDLELASLPDPRRANPELPAPLAELIMSLLALRPEDRPPSAARFLEDVERCRLRCRTTAEVSEQLRRKTEARGPIPQREEAHERIVEGPGPWSLGEIRQAFAEMRGIYKVGLFFALCPPLLFAALLFWPGGDAVEAGSPQYERPSVLDRVSGALTGREAKGRYQSLGDRILELKDRTPPDDFHRRWGLLLAWRRSFPRNERERWLRYDKLLNARISYRKDRDRGCYNLDRILKQVRSNLETMKRLRAEGGES